MPATTTPPQIVMIAGHRIKIETRDLGDDYAEYDHEKRTIALSAKIRGKLLRDSLRHEMMHAALSLSGVAFALPEGQEEAVVRAMDEIFFPAWERTERQLKTNKHGTKTKGTGNKAMEVSRGES